MRLSSPLLIGRDDELAQLLIVAAARPGVAVIEGDAGMGKTRLVEELLARPELSDHRRLVGRCEEYREPFPLGPVTDALRDLRDQPLPGDLSPLIGALRIVLPELGERLPPSPPSVGDPTIDRHLLFRAILGLLVDLGPTVCVLEDLHWADHITAEFLRFLIARLPSPLMLVLTYRREDAREKSAIRALTTRVGHHLSLARIELTPLDVPGVRALIGAILNTDEVSPEFAAHLHRRTAGVPFAVEELIRALGNRADLVRQAGGRTQEVVDALAVPPAIRDTVLERVLRLSPKARRVVEAVAVAGEPADERTVEAIAQVGHSSVPSALREAVETVVLIELPGGTYGLRHALAVDAVYEAIPQVERCRYHARAAEVLEGLEPRPCARLAHHYRRAARLREWIECAEAAAELAVSRQDCESAARYLHELLSSAELTSAQRARIAVKFAEMARTINAHQKEAVAVLQAAIREGRSRTRLLGRARSLLGILLVENGDAVAGRREQARSVEDLRDYPDHAARVMINLAAPWTVEGEEGEHLAWLEQAVRIARRLDDPAARLAVAVARGLIPLYFGDRAGWVAMREVEWSASSVAERRELLRGVSNLTGACFYLGHYSRARQFLADTNRRAAEFGWDHSMQVSQTAALLLDWAGGKWSDLAARAQRLEEATTELPGAAALSGFVAASVAAAAGDSADAERRFRTSMELALVSGNIPGLALAAGGLARMLLLQGRAEAAAEEAHRALDVISKKRIWVWAAEFAPIGVEADLASGRIGDALATLHDFERGLAGRDTPIGQAALLACKAAVAEADRGLRAAAREWSRAARAFRRLPRPYDAALAMVREGTCLLGVGDRSGEAPLVASLTTFESLGASADAARLRRTLRRHSLPVPHTWKTGRRSYGDELSPRELSVVQSVAKGLSNAAIAEILFLSPKTVENHVASAMRKLGVRSRTALAARWQGRSEPSSNGRSMTRR